MTNEHEEDFNSEEENEEEESNESEEESEEEETEEKEDSEGSEELDKLRKENKTLKAQKAKWREKAKKEPTALPQDELNLLRLEARQITNEDDQKYVIRMAKAFEVSPLQALELEEVKTKLEKMKEERTTKEATPRKGKRGASASDSVDYWIRKNELPKDRELRQKVVNKRIEKEKKSKMFNN